MKIFVAGATGAVGRPLVRRLVAVGHEVVGVTRSEEKAVWLREKGATAAVGNALDTQWLHRAVLDAEPRW